MGRKGVMAAQNEFDGAVSIFDVNGTGNRLDITGTTVNYEGAGIVSVGDMNPGDKQANDDILAAVGRNGESVVYLWQLTTSYTSTRSTKFGEGSGDTAFGSSVFGVELTGDSYLDLVVTGNQQLYVYPGTVNGPVSTNYTQTEFPYDKLPEIGDLKGDESLGYFVMGDDNVVPGSFGHVLYFEGDLTTMNWNQPTHEFVGDDIDVFSSVKVVEPGVLTFSVSPVDGFDGRVATFDAGSLDDSSYYVNLDTALDLPPYLDEGLDPLSVNFGEGDCSGSGDLNNDGFGDALLYGSNIVAMYDGSFIGYSVDYNDYAANGWAVQSVDETNKIVDCSYSEWNDGAPQSGNVFVGFDGVPYYSITENSATEARQIGSQSPSRHVTTIDLNVLERKRK